MLNSTKQYLANRFKNSSVLLFLITGIFTNSVAAKESLSDESIQLPRYSTGVESIRDSHQYMQKNKALLYWKISPYYLPQLTDSSCSLASIAMIVNAARDLKVRGSLVTQDQLLQRVNDVAWQNAVKQGGDGVSLTRLKELMEHSLKVYGFSHYTVSTIQLTNSAKESEFALQQVLMESESTGKVFVIANFNQKFFTGTLSVGHFSPIGAYDPASRNVLIMDTDREFYEPYWVPITLLVKAMATTDDSGTHHRGYLIVRFNH